MSTPNHRFALTLCVAATLPLLALAQTPPPASKPATPPPGTGIEATKTLDEAFDKVKSIASFRADVLQDVDMMGQKFQIKGTYLKGPEYRLRLELAVEGLPETEGTMRQICDGKTLWDYSNILGQEYFGRMDVPKILDRLDSPDFDDSFRNFYIRNYFGLSGPQAMLEGLRDSVTFETLTEGDLDGRPVWILRGRWTEMTALGLAPMAQIPAYIPSLVVLWLGKDDGWPYQVLLQGKKRPLIAAERKIQLGPDGRPTGNIIKQQEEPPSRFLVRYENVQINPPVQDVDFAFSVPRALEGSVRDTTAERLAELQNAASIIAVQRQQEAAKADAQGALLKEGIQVPPLGPAPAGAPPLGAAPAPAPGGPPR